MNDERHIHVALRALGRYREEFRGPAGRSKSRELTGTESKR